MPCFYLDINICTKYFLLNVEIPAGEAAVCDLDSMLLLLSLFADSHFWVQIQQKKKPLFSIHLETQHIGKKAEKHSGSIVSFTKEKKNFPISIIRLQAGVFCKVIRGASVRVGSRESEVCFVTNISACLYCGNYYIPW